MRNAFGPVDLSVCHVTNIFAINAITKICSQTQFDRVQITTDYQPDFNNKLNVRQFSLVSFIIFDQATVAKGYFQLGFRLLSCFISINSLGKSFTGAFMHLLCVQSIFYFNFLFSQTVSFVGIKRMIQGEETLRNY